MWQTQSRRLGIAPMMRCSTPHMRQLWRLLCCGCRLYTEMIPAAALYRRRQLPALSYDPAQHPLAVQLGGANPHQLAQCARIVEDQGFDEVNLNVGCPSQRARSGNFGAVLMADPQRVADAVSEMRASVAIPVTVKCRLGIDQQDTEETLDHFVQLVAAAGCDGLIVHARKAWLKGVNPKQNRTLPQLQYARVYRLKKDFPSLHVTLNGGISTLDAIQQHLQQVDGVMIGRAAWQQPWWLTTLAQILYRETPPSSRETVIRIYQHYLLGQLRREVRLRAVAIPLLNLYHGQPHGRIFRQQLMQRIAIGDAQGIVDCTAIKAN